MNLVSKFIISALVLIDILIAVWIFLRYSLINLPVLNPAGIVAIQEKNLMLEAGFLMLLVVIPVFALTIYIAFKYRDTNTSARFEPEWDHDKKLEFLWWAIPCAIIFVLSILAWQSSHALDPYKPLQSSKKPLIIDVIALDWKWLFIYPAQNIASVNLVEFPVNTPLDFYITSDSVMNSFWLPSLGGQIYAMPGMSTQLHLMADKIGDFSGMSANISGKGFSQMTFIAKAVANKNYLNWLNNARSKPHPLDDKSYSLLSKPTVNNPIELYFPVKQNLYNNVVMKYMLPKNSKSVILTHSSQ